MEPALISGIERFLDDAKRSGVFVEFFDFSFKVVAEFYFYIIQYSHAVKLCGEMTRARRQREKSLNFFWEIFSKNGASSSSLSNFPFYKNGLSLILANYRLELVFVAGVF